MQDGRSASCRALGLPDLAEGSWYVRGSSMAEIPGGVVNLIWVGELRLALSKQWHFWPESGRFS